jgi:hypothetical protein
MTKSELGQTKKWLMRRSKSEKENPDSLTITTKSEIGKKKIA